MMAIKTMENSKYGENYYSKKDPICDIHRAGIILLFLRILDEWKKRELQEHLIDVDIFITNHCIIQIVSCVRYRKRLEKR